MSISNRVSKVLFRGAEGGSIRLRRGALLWLILPLAPVLDSRIPALSHDLFVPTTKQRFSGYAFDVAPNGVLLLSCGNHISRLTVSPEKLVSTPSGDFRALKVQGQFCTEFGFKVREAELYVPNELLLPNSEVIQGLWQIRTYPGVPSVKNPDRVLTVQAKRLSADEIELSWLSNDLEEPEFPAVRVKLGQPDEMENIVNWQHDLLPWKSVHFSYDYPGLHDPIVVDGTLSYFAFESVR